MRQIEAIAQDTRKTSNVTPAAIDAEAVACELSAPATTADPHVTEILGANPIRVNACPVCEETNAVPRFAIQDSPFQLVVCHGCGLGTLDPKPAPETIAKFYPPEYYGSPGAKFTPLIEKLVRNAASHSARSFTRNLPKGSRVLDVGCGRGVLLSTLADRGMDAHGFEISETAAIGADPRARITIAPSLEQAAYPDGHFDLVVLCHVLEHLADPKGTLLEIRRILKPGGRLVVAVPNFSSWQAQWCGPAWFHLDLPRHLFHFRSSCLKQLLKVAGFRCRQEQYFSLRQNPFGWVQSLLNKWSGGKRNALYTLLKQNGNSSESTAKGGRKFFLRLAYILGMPIALAFSLVCAVFRQGASITIVAESQRDLEIGQSS